MVAVVVNIFHWIRQRSGWGSGVAHGGGEVVAMVVGVVTAMVAGMVCSNLNCLSSMFVGLLVTILQRCVLDHFPNSEFQFLSLTIHNF